MEKIEIQNRVKEIGEDRDFFMVDLIIDGKTIETGDNHFSSYSFWEEIEQQAQRALYRIKKNNSKAKFDFNIHTMGMSEADKEATFINHLKSKHPELDVDGIIKVFNDEIDAIKQTGPDDNHPNPELKLPINSQLNKRIVVNVIDKFLKQKA